MSQKRKPGRVIHNLSQVSSVFEGTSQAPSAFVRERQGLLSLHLCGGGKFDLSSAYKTVFLDNAEVAALLQRVENPVEGVDVD